MTGIGSATLSLLLNLLITYKVYIGTGIVAFISNVAIISTFLSDQLLRSRYHMLVVLAVAEMINAIAITDAGFARSNAINQVTSICNIFGITITYIGHH
jgi:hypothetical protein